MTDKEKLLNFISEMIDKRANIWIHTIDVSEHEKAKTEAIEYGKRISDILSAPVFAQDDEQFERFVVEDLKMRFTFSYLKE